jgi:hypothetical protein
MKESGALLPKSKGGKYYWKDSPYTGQLNAAQNMLGHNTQGEKNFRDAGYDENAAFKDSMYFKKKKKKGFMGGLGKILKPIAQIASFIPQTAMFARMYLAADALANKNPLGAIANVAGANFGVANAAGNLAGAGTSLAGSGAGYLADALGGGLGANALVSGGLGAMSGAHSGNALKGGLTGGLGALTSGYAGGITDKLGKTLNNPLLAKALVGAGMGAGLGAMTGNAGLGALLGGASPYINTGITNATGSKPLGQFGTGMTTSAIKSKVALDKQKKAIAKAMAQRGVK